MDKRILDWAEKISAGSILVGIFQKDQGLAAIIFGAVIIFLTVKFDGRGK